MVGGLLKTRRRQRPRGLVSVCLPSDFWSASLTWVRQSLAQQHLAIVKLARCAMQLSHECRLFLWALLLQYCFLISFVPFGWAPDTFGFQFDGSGELPTAAGVRRAGAVADPAEDARVQRLFPSCNPTTPTPPGEAQREGRDVWFQLFGGYTNPVVWGWVKGKGETTCFEGSLIWRHICVA